MMPRIRLSTTASVILLGGGLLSLGFAVVPAHASDDGTRTVAWTVTTGDFGNRFGSPQTLYTGDTTCGTGLLQIDLYKYSSPADRATVDALIASGHLDGSYQDSSVYLSNSDVELTPCQTTPPVTATPPITSTPTPPVVVPPATVPPTSTPTDSPSPTQTPTPPSTTPTSPGSTPSPSETATVPPVTPVTSSTPAPSRTTAAPSTPTSAPTSTTPAKPTSAGTGTGTRQNSGTGQTDKDLAMTGDESLVWMRVAVILIISGIVTILLPKKRHWQKASK